MGRLNLGRALDDRERILIDQSEVLTGSGDLFLLVGTVASPADPLRVTLAWTDAPGPAAGAPYVNDLDLVVEVGGQTFLGNVFSGAYSTTGGSPDYRNNVESVFLPAGMSGEFVVRVLGTAIGGDGVPGDADLSDQDFALLVYNATPDGAPVAEFAASTVTGFAPLTVDFEDLSGGAVDGWSWSFGDSGIATDQNPVHTYTASGVYTVKLTASGPGGTDTELKTGYITVTDVPPAGFSDPSFELQTAGLAPGAPWTSFTGTANVIEPTGAAADGPMPTDGVQWCEIAADGTDGATPPSNPGGPTDPPIGGSGIRQDFVYAPGLMQLQFEAVFVRSEGPNEPTFNDWMSVDVSDGSTTVNLFYADTFSPVSGTSVKYGYEMTPPVAVSVDLADLFPASGPTTLFTLTAQIGNGADSYQPSKGYLDNFRLTLPPVPPTAVFEGLPTSGIEPLAVVFEDLSSGDVTEWAWDFGDAGSSSEPSPTHEYLLPGIYTVSLTVTGPAGADTLTLVDYVTVLTAPPVAAFSGLPTSGLAPLAVDFTDLSGGAITNWAWDFGDGTGSMEQHPSKLYETPGTYSVGLTVTGPGGSDEAVTPAYVTVLDPQPVAAFTSSVQAGSVPTMIDFTDTSTGSVTEWDWDFGDGGLASEANPSHTYTTAGTYDVSLTVMGPGGSDTLIEVGFVTIDAVLGIPYCTGAPNSAGVGAGLTGQGSHLVTDNDMILTVAGLPPFVPGLFYFGAQATATPFGEGVRCVGGATTRLQPPNFASAGGDVVRSFDLTAPPLVGVMVPGSTWYFQYWYRDVQGGPVGFNLSDGLEVSWQ